MARSTSAGKLKASISAQKSTGPQLPVTPEFDQFYQDYEKLAEEVGQFTAFRSEVGAYIGQLHTDLTTKRTTRIAVAWLAFAVIAFMAALVAYVLFCPRSPLVQSAFAGDAYLKIALVVAPLTVILTLVAILIRGAFTMPNKDEIPGLPEHVKLIVDAMKNFKSG